MTYFICPVCGAPLQRLESNYRCEKGHSYDISREGYTHLLPANQKHSKVPGDDKTMTAARTRFLNGGWYAPLRDALCALVLESVNDGSVLVDAGCGEGYYTEGIVRALKTAGRTVYVAGVDISKFALKKAAKRTKDAEFAVASVYHLPLRDGCADLLLDCFSPLAVEEYRRVLKKDGYFLYVVPGPAHLMEMKTVLYERPYENPEEQVDYAGFSFEKVVPVRTRFTLSDSDSIMALFGMTPYAWKTPRKGVEQLKALNRLDVTAEFRIHVFQKM